MPSEPRVLPRVLFAASEYAPLTKTGGLADVAAALPAALRRRGADVRVLLPGYREVLAGLDRPQIVAELQRLGSFPPARVLAAAAPDGQPLLVLACPELFERDGGPYLDPAGRDWPDNALRFGYLSYVAAMFGGNACPGDWRPQVLHCNDWQTGLAPAYLHWSFTRAAPALMTIHNLAYQGIFPPAFVARLGLPAQSLDVDGVEYFGSLSFLKAGLYYADRINTVSPTYAREIQAEPLGFGLHGLLAGRSRALEGILNGIDTAVWDPASDRALSATYDADSLERKARNTFALRQRFGLQQRPEIPLLGVVSRLVAQKGIDLVVDAAAALLDLPAQLIVLGTGDVSIERDLTRLARSRRGSVAVIEVFDEALSHLIEAGADMFLMPSRFEPCGLNQMYSQRYGTPPIVRRTGGLADSVVDCTPATLAAGTATGFVFDEASAPALLTAVRRAMAVWRDPPAWQSLQRNAMAREFGWEVSAGRYLDLYNSMLSTA